MMRYKQRNDDWIDNLFNRYNVNTPNELWNELLLKSRCSAIIKYIDNGFFKLCRKRERRNCESCNFR